MNREQIETAFDNFKLATIKEWELGEQMIKLTLEQQKAHKETQLARQAVESLRD